MATTNDPHLLALGQIEADRATGKITAEQYERAKADLTAKHQSATRPWRIGLLIVLLIPLLLIGGCFALIARGGSGSTSSQGASTNSGLRLTSSDVDPWPLTVSEVTLRCDSAEGPKMVTVEADGRTYALNGTAKGFAEEHGWRDLHEIWRDNPEVEGLKVDVGPLIQRGLTLC